MLFCILIEFYLNFCLSSAPISEGGEELVRASSELRGKEVDVGGEGREMDSAPTETLSPASSELCLFFASFLIPESSLGMDNKCMIVYYIGMENENLIPFR
jgi:hypothetical protein